MRISAARNRRTGTKPTTRVRTLTAGYSQDLEGDHPLVALAQLLLEGPRVSPRQHELLVDESREPHVHLGAQRARLQPVRRAVQVGQESPGEERRPEEGRVEGGIPHSAEPDGRENQVEHAPREVGPRERVQLDAGKRGVVPVPLWILVIEPVVAEPTEIEIREGLV